MKSKPRTPDYGQRTILIELGQQFIASLFHISSRVLALFVVKANQVQNPMNEKTRNRAVERNTRLVCLPLGCGKGNDNVTEELGGNIAEFPITHSKGQNIRGALASPIFPVERTHLFIVHEHDTEFALRRCQGA